MHDFLIKNTDIILDSIADGVFTVDSKWRITSFNKSAEKITGIKRDLAIGKHCWEIFKASICNSDCELKKTVESGKSSVTRSIYIVNSDGERIPISISTAALRDEDGAIIGGVESFRDLTVITSLRKELENSHTFFDIVSRNSEMKRLFNIVEMISDSMTSVLLEGESGTGKELFAKAIHSLSSRKEKQLITVNCASIPNSLLESELFGYKKGAFTDAKKDRMGKIALADGGTLFLDEIGELDLSVQAKLLRFLQEKEFEPLGSTKTEKSDTRVITATNKNLEKMTRKGTFREDLYYRINVAKLYLPSLRNRMDDVPVLSDHFIKQFNHIEDKSVKALSDDVISFLMNYRFTGNIRELKNIIEYAMLVCKGDYITMDNLPDYIKKHKGLQKKEVKGLASAEKDIILANLKKNGWNRSLTAKYMNIHTSTLWRKMKKLGIETLNSDGRSKKVS
ncbi:MAG: PAS domain-containing protein [Desulfobacterales bacterium]|nr:PAS domain-containing protein [Desulfobacterales bacterium]MCP4160025.1 PAS domain-containing protein [Deltaproteobacteria bacterium]